MSLCSNSCVPPWIAIAQKMIVLWMKSSGGLLLTLPMVALTIVHNYQDSLGQISKIAFRVPSYQECVCKDTQYLNMQIPSYLKKNLKKNPQTRRSWGKVLELLFLENTCTYSPPLGESFFYNKYLLIWMDTYIFITFRLSENEFFKHLFLDFVWVQNPSKVQIYKRGKNDEWTKLYFHYKHMSHHGN